MANILPQQLPSPQRLPKLLDRVRQALRRKHYSYRTGQAYIHWIKRYIYFREVLYIPFGDVHALRTQKNTYVPPYFAVRSPWD